MSDQPLISIDVVALRLNRAAKTIEVALAERKFSPAEGALALPGVLLLAQERLAAAVERALASKAGIPRDLILATGDVGVFDTPGRDPRGPTLSITRYAIVAPDFIPGDGVKMVPLSDATALPFDHDTIVRRTARVAHDQLWVDHDFTKALIGQAFTVSDAANAHDALSAIVGAAMIDRKNANRLLTGNPWLSDPKPGVARGEGRPARIWDFV